MGLRHFEYAERAAKVLSGVVPPIRTRGSGRAASLGMVVSSSIAGKGLRGGGLGVCADEPITRTW